MRKSLFYHLLTLAKLRAPGKYRVKKTWRLSFFSAFWKRRLIFLIVGNILAKSESWRQIMKNQPGRQGLPRWRAESCLFPALPAQAAGILEALPRILEQVWPLSRGHRRQLPADIHELSLLLTSQRGRLRQNYWRRPAFVSAYLYYFLPWNLVRFCRLFAALPLRPPAARAPGRPLLADAGAGPLAASIALWISRPEWRSAQVTVFGLDAVRQPLELGAKLFAALARHCAEPAWQTLVAAGPLEALASLAPERTGSGLSLEPWLAVAANVLNEIRAPRSANIEAPDFGRFAMLLAAWRPFWQTGSQLLFMEPGTRLGGTIIMRLRAAALELGLSPLSPCVHAAECPLDEAEKPGLPSRWCHFVFSALDAPEWLRELSRKAGLFKTSLTLSPLLLSAGAKLAQAPADALPARVVSQTFPAGGQLARYGCCHAGLALLPDSRNLLSGSLCLAARPEAETRDAHSGALILAPRKTRN